VSLWTPKALEIFAMVLPARAIFSARAGMSSLYFVGLAIIAPRKDCLRILNT
jgi:hypothetical protein